MVEQNTTKSMTTLVGSVPSDELVTRTQLEKNTDVMTKSTNASETSNETKTDTNDSKESRISNGYVEKILAKCAKYINDQQIVYKMSYDLTDNRTTEWLVVMQKLQDTSLESNFTLTKTNENRKGIVDKSYANFRANKLKVIEIFKMSDPEISREHIINTYMNKKVTYCVNQIVEPDFYDDNIENVYSGGIHYFKTPQGAIYYMNYPKKFTGKWSSYYSNGQKIQEGEVVNGKLSGHYIKFNYIGEKCLECYYDNGKLSGKYTKYYANGEKYTECYYKNEKLSGKYIEFHANGEKYIECHYDDNIASGTYKSWYYNGKKQTEGEYLNGMQTGVWIVYDCDGNKESEGCYDKSRKTGKHISYYPNGEKKIEETYLDDKLIVKPIKWDENGFEISNKKKEIKSEEKEYSFPKNEYIDKILTKCAKYINDPSYVYKMSYNLSDSVATEWLVVMEKLPETITNEDRKNVANMSYAKFRANKLKVIEIFKMHDPEISKEYVTNYYMGERTIYKVNEIAYPNSYDENSENVCSEGIHYFKTPRGVIYYSGPPKNFTGEWVTFFDNGSEEKLVNMINGMLMGKSIEFYKDEGINVESYYENSILTGLLTKRFKNGEKQYEGNYLNGKRTGKWFEWNDTKKLIKEYNYLNGKRTGKQITHDLNENTKIECEYENNIKSGKYICYFSNGQKCEEGQYLMGAPVGKWSEWGIDGVEKNIVYDSQYAKEKQTGMQEENKQEQNKQKPLGMSCSKNIAFSIFACALMVLVVRVVLKK